MYDTAFRPMGATEASYAGGYPLRGLAGAKMGLGQMVPDGMMDNMTAKVGIGGGAALGMVGAGLYGGIIGGITTQSWKGAATGGLAAAAISGVSTGIGLSFMRLYVPAAIALGLGAGAAYWTYTRTWG
jgi:hypothetical protein